MDLLLWTGRSLHIFSVVVWFGGLLYQAVATFPVARVEQKDLDNFTRHLLRRFQPFVWMCIWTILITGIVLMLLNPKFVFFRYDDRWSALLGLKELAFMLMIFFSFGYARMLKRIDELLSKNERKDAAMPFYRQLLVFGKINVALAIVALLLSAGLNS